MVDRLRVDDVELLRVVVDLIPDAVAHDSASAVHGHPHPGVKSAEPDALAGAKPALGLANPHAAEPGRLAVVEAGDRGTVFAGSPSRTLVACAAPLRRGCVASVKVNSGITVAYPQRW